MSLELIKKYNIKAKKSLGQNFLVNEEIVEDISESIEVKWQNIVEVWPGYWALTEKLILQKPKSLTLVELDKDMILLLEKRIKNWDFDLLDIDFSIENIDVLKYEPIFDNYSIIANIPYYITSPILRHFLYNVSNKPKNMVILMQKDVGDKILWKWKKTRWIVPKSGQERVAWAKSSVLSLFIEKKCYVTEQIIVWKENFIPSPKVESSVLLFESHDVYDYIDDDSFLELIKKWFKEPRKKLIKNLSNSGYEKDFLNDIFSKMSIEENTRWEDLTIADWCRLSKEFNK